jgi:hypothetical protein
MGALNIIISAFILVVFLLVLMQPILILWDVAQETFVQKNTTMYGTDSDGNVVAVGDGLFAMDLTLGILSLIGIAFVVGFILWAAKGGKSEVEELMDQQRGLQ